MADNVVSSHVGLRSGEPADAKPSSTSLPPSGSLTPSEDEKALDDPLYKSGQSSLYDIQSVAPLAPRQDKPPTPGHALLVWLRLRKPDQRPDWDAVATSESVYDTPFAQLYKPSAKYENSANFDPSFRWTYREERAVTRKVDIKILLWILLMFLALDIDRANIGNATADNLLHDLKITQADYNFGATLSKLGFLTAELPSQMIGKKLGVDIWLPTQLVVFSILAFAQFWMRGRSAFLALRFLIAFFQGGFIPDAVLYLSYYYTKNQLPVRLALFWSINYLANILTGFLGVGLIEMRGVLGHPGWAWMFLIEGLITLVIGIASYFMLAPGPSQTKAKWRPKGYFNEKEVKIIVNRVIRDDPTKGTMHNRQALTLGLLWKSLKDYDLWPMYLVGLLFGIAGYPVSQYFQISMKRLGFSTLMANLLSVPYGFIGIFNLILITIASEVFNSRTWLSIAENLWFLPFVVALRVLNNPTPWTYFAIATLLLGYPYVHAIQVGWCSRNSGSVRTRTVSASVYNMFVQVSGIVGANIYQASDAPHYRRGNTILLVIVAFNLVVLYPGVWLYYKVRNASKERQWSKLSEKEKAHYLETTTDEGARRLDFRFAY